jgi:hypothetical protein
VYIIRFETELTWNSWLFGGQLEVCRFLKLHGADIYGYVGRQ